jgi:predicted outer membrane protein
MASRRNALLAAAALAVGSVAYRASAQSAQQLNQADPQIAQHLSQVDTMARNTVQVAQLAQKKAQAPAAKNLANQVVKDYQNILNQLQGIAKQRGIALNQNPHQAAMQSDLKGVLADLNARNGADFDRQFVQFEVGGFQKFEQAMKDLRGATPGQDAQIKGWLDQAENVTEASLTQARSAQQQLASAGK